MQIEQTQWTQGKGWKPAPPGRLGAGAHLVLLFGGTDVLKEQHHLDELTQAYPNAHLLGGRKKVAVPPAPSRSFLRPSAIGRARTAPLSLVACRSRREGAGVGAGEGDY